MANTEVYIYGSIGRPWWADEGYDGVNEKDVLDALNSLDKADKHTVHFNSGGGVVKVGIGIMNIMRDHIKNQRLTNSNFMLRTVNDGICYSAASYPFLIGNERIMNLGSNVLVHRCSTYGEGNADELQNVVDELRGMDENLAILYSNILGKTPEHWTNLMALDKVVNGERAVELGLATEVDNNSDLKGATNMFPEFSPENVGKEGYRRILERSFHTMNCFKREKGKVLNLLAPPKSAPTPRKTGINNRLVEARINAALARLPH